MSSSGRSDNAGQGWDARVALARLSAVVAVATLLSAGAISLASAQSSSTAKTNASQAQTAKDNATAASKKAAEDAAKAAAAKKATEDAAAAAKASAAQAAAAQAEATRLKAERDAVAAQRAAQAAAAAAEADRQRLASEQEAARAAAAKAEADAKAAAVAAAQAEADKRVAEAAAADAAEAHRQAALRAAAEAEAKRLRDAEAAALKAASDRSNMEKEQAKAAEDRVKENKTKADENEVKSRTAAEEARAESDKAKEAADKAETSSNASSNAADRAAEKAAEAEAAEQRWNNARTDEERENAMRDLDDASNATSVERGNAEKHAQDADGHGYEANDHKDRANRHVDELPPPTPDVRAVLTSRSWLMCGGSYAGWSGPGLCAAVTLDAVSDGNGLATIMMKVRNLSGLFQSYAGSVLTGIGLSNILGTNPTDLEVQGPCVPTDQNCAAQWGLAVGHPHAHMPNGIGAVDMKISTNGITGGITSNCAAQIQPPQIDADGNPVSVPENPNGLFTTDCFGDDWVTMSFTTTAPVDFTYTELSLRAQNGYPNGSGSTACIFSGDAGTPLQNDCMPRTPPPPGTVTPEPATIVLLGSGLAGMAGALRRRRKRGAPPLV